MPDIGNCFIQNPVRPLATGADFPIQIEKINPDLFRSSFTFRGLYLLLWLSRIAAASSRAARLLFLFNNTRFPSLYRSADSHISSSMYFLTAFRSGTLPKTLTFSLTTRAGVDMTP